MPADALTETGRMREARQLIAFYDERGWNWESALGFTLCRDMFGPNFVCHQREGYRCYPHKERKNANHIHAKKNPSVSARV